jgi:hypothetical protein
MVHEQTTLLLCAWEGVNCAGVDFSQVMHDYAGKYEEEYMFKIIAWVV